MTRVLQFFRDVRGEMAKVVWPSRREAVRYTITVIIFSIILAVILGAADYGLLQGFEALLNR